MSRPIVVLTSARSGAPLNRRVRRGFAALFAIWIVLAAHDTAPAQSIRVSGSTSLRYIEVRPFVRDSVPADAVEGSGLLRQTAEGRVVRCVTGDVFCRGVRPADPVSTVPAIQDLELSAWGVGEGIRVFAQARARTGWGGDPHLWPRADDAFDLLAAYGEIDRERFRFRAGRQWQVSGLGFYNFDGLALALRPWPAVSIEGYAGRSLVRGLNETRTGGALQAIEPLAPEAPGLLVGVQARYRPSRSLALSALYHRDIRRDRAALYSELAGFDGVYRAHGASVEGSLELDVAAGGLNEARLRLRSPPFRRAVVHGEVRRYRPYFELWTIWGAFSPVGFDEAQAGVTWARPRGDLIVRGNASYRSYDDTGLDEGVGNFRTNGWGLGASASWSASPEWRVEGGYRFEVGFGAARSEGHGALVRRLGDRGSVSLRGMAFQRLYEFRLDEGMAIGFGADTSLRLTERARVFGSLMSYRHIDGGDAPDMDWTQLRGNLRLQWTVGAEPETAPRLPTAPGGGS